MNVTYKHELEKGFTKRLDAMNAAVRTPALLLDVYRRSGTQMGYEDYLEQIELETYEFAIALSLLKQAKILLFPAHQLQSIINSNKDYADKVEYLLPFPSVFLQFDEPIAVSVDGYADTISAIIMNQIESTPEIRETARNNLMGSRLKLADVPDGQFMNSLIVVFSDGLIRKISWAGDRMQSMKEFDNANALGMFFAQVQRMAVSAIGYVNCENVYLHKVDGALDAVNRKRAAKGKATIEPYYTCRIRGVNYDNPVGTGKGTSPGHIFDVRGHFRRLDSGKVTWVRPHLRGLKSGGEYVPKVYAVDSR